MHISAQFPQPNSMRASEAASWYRAMIQLIPKLGIDVPSGEDDCELKCNTVIAYWNTRCRLRLAAALALYDQALVAEFFERFPLPSAMDFLGQAFFIANGRDIDVFDIAKRLLLEVTDLEMRYYPATADGMPANNIGMTYQTPDGVYELTREGWERKQ